MPSSQQKNEKFKKIFDQFYRDIAKIGAKFQSDAKKIIRDYKQSLEKASLKSENPDAILDRLKNA